MVSFLFLAAIKPDPKITSLLWSREQDLDQARKRYLAYLLRKQSTSGYKSLFKILLTICCRVYSYVTTASEINDGNAM